MTIIFDKCGMIEQAKKNPHSLVDLEICPPHITKVWNAISEFVQQQFCLGHGVKIPGLGSITFKVYQSDVSHTTAIVDKIPLLLLSEQVVQKYALKAKRPAFNLDIPETPLNYSAIAAMVCLPRAMVETCVEEVVQAFTRAIVEDNHVEFHLPKIGRLIVKSCHVRSQFCPEFLCRFGFGEEIILDKMCPPMKATPKDMEGMCCKPCQLNF